MCVVKKLKVEGLLEGTIDQTLLLDGMGRACAFTAWAKSAWYAAGWVNQYLYAAGQVFSHSPRSEVQKIDHQSIADVIVRCWELHRIHNLCTPPSK